MTIHTEDQLQEPQAEPKATPAINNNLILLFQKMLKRILMLK